MDTSYSHKIYIQPPALQQGDKVALISTARKIDPAQIVIAKEIISSWGYEAITGPNILAKDHQFCGTDRQRADDLQWAINDHDIKAIICFRGGYGTVRVLDLVDFKSFVHYPKWVVGYSDVTALHNKIHKLEVASIHGTMPVNFASNTPEALHSLKAALENQSLSYQFDSHPLNRFGKTSEMVIGGNLSMLYSLTGTRFDINYSGKILFLEDLDEYLYHIDRMMQNMKYARNLENLAGLIVGSTTDMNDNTIPFGKNAEEIIAEAVEEYDFPVCFNFPAGHIDDNRSIVLGKKASLIVSEEGVRFEQA